MPRLFRQRTGLVVDAYFSGTKLKWLLDHIPGARARAERGELAFGTIDSWLAWKLSAGRVHVTDPSNASRTLLFDIGAGCWDEELLALLDIPPAVLPQVVDSSGVITTIAGDLLGADTARRHRRRPAGGDLRPGLPRTGHGQEYLRHRLLPAAEHRRHQAMNSRHRMLATIGWRRASRRPTCSKAASSWAAPSLQWLRDGLGMISRRTRSSRWRRRSPTVAASIWSRHTPASARRTGIPTRAAPCSA
jgi:glycerol kinase